MHTKSYTEWSDKRVQPSQGRESDKLSVLSLFFPNFRIVCDAFSLYKLIHIPFLVNRCRLSTVFLLMLLSQNEKRKRSPLTCTCDCDSSCSNSFRSQLYLWPGAEMMISMTSRQRNTASPGGARVGDITVELILSYSYRSTPRQPTQKKIKIETENNTKKKTKMKFKLRFIFFFAPRTAKN